MDDKQKAKEESWSRFQNDFRWRGGTIHEAWQSGFDAGLVHAQQWVDVNERLPEVDMVGGVLARYFNPLGKSRTVRATYIPKFTVEDHGDDGEYNEADDTYYFKEGWYELCESNPDDLIYPVAGTVIEWTNLPPFTPKETTV